MRRLVFLVLQCCLVAWCVGSVHAGTVELPQSGQMQCYDTTDTEIPCAGSGQDGDIRAGVAWPEPRFTVSGDCVTDNLTGLMWVKSPDSITRQWDIALSYANNLVLCGYDDWRLPNINELRSLVHSGYNEESCGGVPCVYLSDWLNSKGFSNVQSTFYWSSTTFAYYLTDAWEVNMRYGIVAYFYKSESEYVWPVRGGQNDSPDPIYPANIWKTGQTVSYRTGDDGDLERGVAWPNPRFIDQGDGTVRDNLTGLIWLKEADCFGMPPWGQALSFANGLASGQCWLSDGSHAGDWRLPNREELESLIDFSQHDPALPAGHPFSNVRSYLYWTSTTSAYFTDYAWFVTMWIGYVSSDNKANSNHYVWPVRRGQVGSFCNLTVDPTSYDFGNVHVGSSSAPQTFTISNTGSADLHISGMSLSDTTNYSLDVNGGTNPCGSTTPTIAPNSSCTVTVTFSPSSTGTKNATITINSDDPDTPTLNVSVSGTGIPMVECNLVPDATTIHRGGTLGFQATVANNTDEVQVFKFATRITKPSGGKYPATRWLKGPFTVNLGPLGSISRHLSQYIPYTAPLGTYTYHGYVGLPGNIYDECWFNFTVTEQGQGCTQCHQ